MILTEAYEMVTYSNIAAAQMAFDGSDRHIIRFTGSGALNALDTIGDKWPQRTDRVEVIFQFQDYGVARYGFGDLGFFGGYEFQNSTEYPGFGFVSPAGVEVHQSRTITELEALADTWLKAEIRLDENAHEHSSLDAGVFECTMYEWDGSAWTQIDSFSLNESALALGSYEPNWDTVSFTVEGARTDNDYTSGSPSQPLYPATFDSVNLDSRLDVTEDDLYHGSISNVVETTQVSFTDTTVELTGTLEELVFGNDMVTGMDVREAGTSTWTSNQSGTMTATGEYSVTYAGASSTEYEVRAYAEVSGNASRRYVGDVKNITTGSGSIS